jgi:hypothetical protein
MRLTMFVAVRGFMVRSAYRALRSDDRNRVQERIFGGYYVLGGMTMRVPKPGGK